MAEVTYNFNAQIINNGTLNGDIINPVYNCNGKVDIPAQDKDDLITSAIMKLNDRGIIKYKNDWQYIAYVLIEFCKWENSPNAVYAKFESLGFTDASVFSVPCVRDSLLKDFCFRSLETLQKSSTLDKASNAKYLIAKTLKEELEECSLA